MTTKAKVGDIILLCGEWCLIVMDNDGELYNIILSDSTIGSSYGIYLLEREPIFNLAKVIKELQDKYHEAR